MKIQFVQLITPTPKIVKILNKWANDPVHTPLMRPNRNQADPEVQSFVTEASLTERLEHNLYKNRGYQEIGRIKEFTYWQGKMWTSIHMEKYLN